MIQAACKRCGAMVSPDSPRCSACGAAVEGFVPQAEGAAPTKIATKPAKVDWLDRPAYVLAATFFAMAILGIPFIWKCRGFSRTQKIWWTIITLIYTAIVFWAFGSIMMWCYRRIVNSL